METFKKWKKTEKERWERITIDGLHDHSYLEKCGKIVASYHSTWSNNEHYDGILKNRTQRNRDEMNIKMYKLEIVIEW